MKSLPVYLLHLLALLSVYALKGQETQIQYLSGTGNDKTVNWQFFCTEGMNSGRWTTIPVPSNWELQGFGKYNYGFSKDSAHGKEKGLYKYSFTVPPAWKGKVINIVFEGAMTDTEVKINGKPAGPVHQGAYYRFKYDVSRLLNYDSANLLEAAVAKHSSNESVNEAERRGDFWIFGGIFRPVYLEALPAEHIKRVALNADAKGRFNARVFIRHTNATAVSAQLLSLKGQKIGSAFTARISQADSVASVSTTIPSPLLWTSETPNLLRVEFTLLYNAKPLHMVKERFGFRTIEVKERDGVYINGTKVKFKGVNRHSFWPSSGRAVSESISLMDVQLMKDMNMNAVRMSHYPADAHFYATCDSLGLYVLDELAGWHGNYNTETGTRLLKAMIAKNGNHPSIVIWDNGNEGGHNYDLDPVFAEADFQKRHVIHPWEDFGGFDTQHYREYNYGIANYEHGHSIVMPTEFLHGMYDGGHGAGLQDYWEAMWANPLSAGGFLWDFADQGVVRTDKNGFIDTDGNRGADGIVGPHREKEGSYYAIKEIWSPVYVERREITAAFDGNLDIQNRYHFTNLKQCSFRWMLKNLKDTTMPAATGTIVSPDVKPLERGRLHLSLPEHRKQYDVLYVTASGPDKKEIFTWSFPVTRPAAMVKELLPADKNEKVQLVERDSIFAAAASGVTVLINKRSGLLVSVQNEKGSIPFSNGPVLQEGVNNFRQFTHRFDGNNLVISSTFNRKDSYNTLEWTIFPSGIVKMQVNYFPDGYFTAVAGINFSFPEKEIKGVEYMGNGPYRVWKNRMKGNRFGVWKKAYNNTETGEVPFLYPEFKGYHSNMYWCRFITTGQPFTVLTPDEDLFFRLFMPAFKEDQWKNYDLVFPTGDISFLHGIPGIGTKTQKTENSGPMGMKNIFYDYEKDPRRWLKMTLYFDFRGK